jgi:hypothetical protein
MRLTRAEDELDSIGADELRGELAKLLKNRTAPQLRFYHASLADGHGFRG